MRPLPISAYLIILPPLFSMVQGAVVRHCTGFEGQLGEFIPSFKIHTEYPSTVLISYLNDFDQHLMTDLDLDVTMGVADYWYPLYKDNNTFDESVVLVSKPAFEFVNTELQEGESVLYNATLAGVYCALINQHNTSEVDLEGLHITTTHVYGDYKLTGYNWLKLILLIIPVVWFHHSVIPRLFPKLQQYDVEEDVWSVLKYAVIGKFGASLPKVPAFGLMLLCGEYTGNLRSLFFFNFWSLLNHLLSLVVIASFYKVAIGVFSFKKGMVEGSPGKYHRRFNVEMVYVLYLVELICFPMMPAYVSLAQYNYSIFAYSIVCDWEGALFGMVMTFAQDELYQIRQEAILRREIPRYKSKLYNKTMQKPHRTGGVREHINGACIFIGVSLLCSVLGACGIFFGDYVKVYHIIDCGSKLIGYFKVDMYRLNDPRMSYNYLIMWNVVCNWEFGLIPGIRT